MRQKKMKTQFYNICGMGCTEITSNREVDRDKVFLKNQDMSQINELTYHLKDLLKKNKQGQSQQIKGNNKDQRRNFKNRHKLEKINKNKKHGVEKIKLTDL